MNSAFEISFVDRGPWGKHFSGIFRPGRIACDASVAAGYEPGLLGNPDRDQALLAGLGDIHGLGRLAGGFSLALFDHRRDRLVLARDAAGSWPLYVHKTGDGQVLFATELDALLRRIGQTPDISVPGLHEYLRFLDIAPPRTIYEGVWMVPAGSALRIGTDTWEEIELASPPVKLPAGYESAVGDIEVRLDTAIRTMADDCGKTPLAFLSGGIDSALICALGARSGAVSEAVTVGFSSPGYDESAIAGDIARHLGLRHHIIRPDPAAFADAFSRTHARADQPFCDPAGMATRLAFEFCAARGGGVFDGTGAEVLPGVMPARWRRIAHDWSSRLPRPVRHGIAGALSISPGIRGYRRLFDFDEPPDLFIRWGGFTARQIGTLTGHPVDLGLTRFYQAHAELRGQSHLRRNAILQGQIPPDDRLRQASWATGLPALHPFLAPEVRNLLARLPEAWCHEPGRPKRILRDLLARHVPAAVWDQPKHGFEFDFRQFMRMHRSMLVDRYLDDGSSVFDGLLDRQAIRALLTEWRGGSDRQAFRVWGLLILSAWLAERPGFTYKAR